MSVASSTESASGDTEDKPFVTTITSEQAYDRIAKIDSYLEQLRRLDNRKTDKMGQIQSLALDLNRLGKRMETDGIVSIIEGTAHMLSYLDEGSFDEAKEVAKSLIEQSIELLKQDRERVMKALRPVMATIKPKSGKGKLKKLLKGCGMEHLLGKGYVLAERQSDAEPYTVMYDEPGLPPVKEFSTKDEALAFINASLGDYDKAVKDITDAIDDGLVIGGEIDLDGILDEVLDTIEDKYPSLSPKEINKAIKQAVETVFGSSEEKPAVSFGSGKITMTKKQFLKEHRNLLKVLKEAKPKALKKEYEEQKKEMSKYTGKGLTGGAYRAIQIEVQVPQDVWVIQDSRTGEYYKEGDNVPTFELRSHAEQYIADLMSGAIQQAREEQARAGTPPRGAQGVRQPPPAPRRGRGKFGLTKGQHSHLKKELAKFGEAVDVDTLLAHLNRTAKKPQQRIESADNILEYVRAKASAPDNEHWSITGDKYVRYTGSGLTGKGDDDEEGLVYKNPLPPVRRLEVPDISLATALREIRQREVEAQRPPPIRAPTAPVEAESPRMKQRRRRTATSPIYDKLKAVKERHPDANPIEETIYWLREPPYEPASYAAFLTPLLFPFAPADIRDQLLKDHRQFDKPTPDEPTGFKPYEWRWYQVGDDPRVNTFVSGYADTPEYKRDLADFLKKREEKLKETWQYITANKDKLQGKGKGKSLPGYAEFVKQFKAKTGGGKKTHRESFLKKHKLPADASLSIKEIAKVSGYPVKTLQEVYNRGIGAYQTNPESVRLEGSFKKDPKAPLSKKLSKEQWGMARVYSFVDGNKKHDADLR